MKFVGCWICGVIVAAVSVAQGLQLVREGQPLADVWYEESSEEGGWSERRAADELTGIVQRMSGAVLVHRQVPRGVTLDALPMPAIVLGRLAERLGVRMKQTSSSKDGFRIREKEGRLFIVGESAQGVYHGVMALLESWGCGWYVPGEVGEVIPVVRNLSVPMGEDREEVSDSVSRRFWYGGKNGVGLATAHWIARNKADRNAGSWNHAWAGLVPASLFSERPELFSLKRGGRSPGQLCTSNPETVRIAAEALLQRMEKEPGLLVYPAGPNDGGNLCECFECSRLNTEGYIEPSSGLPVATDRVFDFAHRLAERTVVRFPDRLLGILIYSEYSRPPARLRTLHPNIFPMFAPIRRCRFHGPNQPGCPWGGLWGEEIATWRHVTSKMGFYVYNYNLADALLPLNKTTFYKRLVEAIRETEPETLAWIFETIDAWGAHAPHLYLSVRLAWNSRVDVGREMDRFYQGFYGAAAEPMRRYWVRIDEAYAQAPTHTGSLYGQPQIWTEALLNACREDLLDARRLAATAREREAVAMAEAGFRCAELFVAISRNIRLFDFEEAGRFHEALRDHIRALAAKVEPAWVHERYTWGYYARFLGETVEGGRKISEQGGEILVRFPDVWRFRKDENGEGVESGWFRVEYDDSEWVPLATVSKSWDDQGLGTYHGDAWYRVRFEVPALGEGDFRLWFGGFDENVDVYLNGVLLGEKSGFARPTEFEGIGTILKGGTENVLAVRVSNRVLGEMGTGGLMMPVLIYRAGRDESDFRKGKKESTVEYSM